MISTSKLGIEPQKSLKPLKKTWEKTHAIPPHGPTSFKARSSALINKSQQKYQWNIILGAFLMANQPGSSSETAGLAFLEDVQTSFVHILALVEQNPASLVGTILNISSTGLCPSTSLWEIMFKHVNIILNIAWNDLFVYTEHIFSVEFCETIVIGAIKREPECQCT